MFARLASDVSLGKSGNADAEVAGLTNKFHELIRVFKAAGRHLKVSAARRIAAQGQNVADTKRADLAEQLADLFLGRTDAGQVRDGKQAVLLLDAVHDHQRLG